MSWDVNAAAEYLDRHANGTTSLHRCAEYTSNAIGHGGVHILRHHSAKDFGSSLVAAGFLEVTGDDYQRGDVVVIQGFQGHTDGHMAMYDGERWVSDFKQRTLYPGESYRAARPSYVVYRHP